MIKSKVKAGDELFMVLVHQRSLNSESVLDQSQMHVFPKGSHCHTELNEGKPCGKSHLQFRYKCNTSSSSLLVLVKLRNPLEFVDLFSALCFSPLTLDWWLSLGLTFWAGCWGRDTLPTPTPCQLNSVGLGITWCASASLNQAERRCHFSPPKRRSSQQYTEWLRQHPLCGLGGCSRCWRQVTLLPLCILPTSSATTGQGHRYQQRCHLNTKWRQEATLSPPEPGKSPGGSRTIRSSRRGSAPSLVWHCLC